MFESFVNSERCKTDSAVYHPSDRLRALLIQKDVKLSGCRHPGGECLRALLIQKDVKHRTPQGRADRSLRALLIQKDVKR